MTNCRDLIGRDDLVGATIQIIESGFVRRSPIVEISDRGSVIEIKTEYTLTSVIGVNGPWSKDNQIGLVCLNPEGYVEESDIGRIDIPAPGVEKSFIDLRDRL